MSFLSFLVIPHVGVMISWIRVNLRDYKKDLDINYDNLYLFVFEDVLFLKNNMMIRSLDRAKFALLKLGGIDFSDMYQATT